MLSDGERSDEDSRLDESTATNGDHTPKAEISQSAKVNGNPDDGDESSMASTSKDLKESKDRGSESGHKSKTKKKKKGAAYHRLRYDKSLEMMTKKHAVKSYYENIRDYRDFRKSKGYEMFNHEHLTEEDKTEMKNIEEEEIVTHVIGKKPLLGKVWKDKTSSDYVRYRCYSYGIEYRIGEAVYIESQRPEQPFYICQIHVSFNLYFFVESIFFRQIAMFVLILLFKPKPFQK